jgi:hypothetical protein
VAGSFIAAYLTSDEYWRKRDKSKLRARDKIAIMFKMDHIAISVLSIRQPVAANDAAFGRALPLSRGRPPMLVVLLLVVLGLVGVTVVLLQRKQNGRSSSGNSYFTHTLGVDDPAPPAAKDDTPAA